MRRLLLPVSEIFYSLQGEGLRTAQPSFFIRFAGCNLNCWYCDTNTSSYSWMSPKEILKEVEQLRKGKNRSNFPFDLKLPSRLDYPDIDLRHSQQENFKLQFGADSSAEDRHISKPPWIVLTGGEPLIQNQKLLEILGLAFKQRGYLIQLETNGSLPCQFSDVVDHITVSPKETVDCSSSQSQKEVIILQKSRDKIKEVKLPIKVGDKPKIYLKNVPHFLQPIDTGNKQSTKNNIKYCQELVNNYPDKWKVSLQMHKVWGIK